MFISLLLHATWAAVTSTLIWTKPNLLCWGKLPYYWVFVFNRPLNGLQNIMRIWTITQCLWTQRSLKPGFENLKTILLQHGKYNPSWSQILCPCLAHRLTLLLLLSLLQWKPIPLWTNNSPPTNIVPVALSTSWPWQRPGFPITPLPSWFFLSLK